MENIRKITVITLQNIRNYGSALQALATQEMFRQLGCEVDFINYVRNSTSSSLKKFQGYMKGKSLLIKVVAPFILYPTFYLQDKRFRKFLKCYLNEQTVIVHDNEDCKKLPLTSDIYCTGSDQTWNSRWNGGILPEMFLDFVPNNIRKISYAASFGKSQLDNWEKEETQRLLKRYHAISVRERSAVDIISGLGINGAVHVLDPTLQMNRNFWMKYAGKRKVEVPYVLIYQLNTNLLFDKYAKEYAKRRGIKLIRFCTRIDQCMKCGEAQIVPNVLDFVNLIAYADTVITDSFHATAFSINMNTNFISIYPNDYSSRLASILELTNLSHRRLINYDDFSFVASDIDFTVANRILCRERAIGKNFLEKVIKL